MSDSFSDPQQQGRRFENQRDGGRGSSRSGRSPGNRDLGGFRIRLSDNEMRSARALQEAFNLRSTVAVLGFALRTLGQMLEEGKIDDLISQHQTQTPKGGGHREDGNNNYGNRMNRVESNKSNFENSQPKPNPFARPEKPPQSKSISNKEESTTTEEINKEEEESNQHNLDDSNEEDKKPEISSES